MLKHDGVVHEPVEDGCGDDGVTEDGAPVGQALWGSGILSCLVRRRLWIR
jgi:hypothetical protein